MRNEKKISVCVVVLNAEKTLTRTVESVINQSRLPYEILIVDGGSTDNTQALAQGFSARCQLVKYISQKDSGIYEGFNNALKHAVGDYISYLNSGDILYPKCLEFVSELVSARPDLDCIFLSCDYGEVGSDIVVSTHTPSVPGQFAHPATFVRRDFYMRNGAFNEDLRIFSDSLFFKKQAIYSFDNHYFSSFIGAFMDRGGVSSKRTIFWFRDYYKYLLLSDYSYYSIFIELSKEMLKAIASSIKRVYVDR